jgi:hypothetical protein
MAKGGSLLVFWPYSVSGQNHLCVMMWLKGIPLLEWCQKILPASQKNFKFPVSRPDDVSSRADDVSFHPDIRQTSIICPEDVFLPFGHLHRIEKLLCQLAPSGRFSSTSGSLSVLERFTDSFQVQESEDQSTVQKMWYPVRTCISVRQELQFKMNRPDIWQLWSGCWCFIYGNCRFDFNRPDVSPSWSGLTRIRYGNCMLKFSRPDASAPWSGRVKPVMEITCSGRGTIEPSRPDDVLIKERFFHEIFGKSCRTVVRPDGHGPPSGRLPGIFLPDAHSDP